METEDILWWKQSTAWTESLNIFDVFCFFTIVAWFLPFPPLRLQVKRSAEPRWLVQDQGNFAERGGLDIGRDEGFGTERKRRRWLPHWAQMELHEQAIWWKVKQSGLKCVDNACVFWRSVNVDAVWHIRGKLNWHYQTPHYHPICNRSHDCVLNTEIWYSVKGWTGGSNLDFLLK